MVITALAAALLGGGGLVASAAPAAHQATPQAVQAPKPANVNDVGSAPRIVGFPGTTLAAGQQTTIKIGGQTFGGVAVPANATGVTLSVTTLNTTGTGGLKLWTTGAGEPGPTNVDAVQGQEHTGFPQVGLSDTGTIDVKATVRTTFVMALLRYNTPVAAPAPTRQTVFDANTVLTGRPDSGSHGTWATDTIGREAHLNDQGAALSSHCNGLPNCHFYTGTITDMGTFTTIDGAPSPEAGTPITGSVTGQIVGAEQVEFFANTLADSSRVPATMDGTGVATSDWFRQFFPSGAFFSGENEITWGWTYATACESWTNAKSGDSGDITGADCSPAAASTKAAVTGAPSMHLISVIHQDPAFICPQPCRFAIR